MKNIPLPVLIVLNQAVALYGSDGAMRKVKRQKIEHNHILYPEEQLKQALITHTSLANIASAPPGVFPIIDHVLEYVEWQEIGKHTVKKVAYKKKSCGGANNLRALCVKHISHGHRSFLWQILLPRSVTFPTLDGLSHIVSFGDNRSGQMKEYISYDHQYKIEGRLGEVTVYRHVC